MLSSLPCREDNLLALGTARGIEKGGEVCALILTASPAYKT